MRKKGKALSRHTINTPQITPVCYGYPHVINPPAVLIVHRPHSPACPVNISSPCSTTGRTASRFSFTAFDCPEDSRSTYDFGSRKQLCSTLPSAPLPPKLPHRLCDPRNIPMCNCHCSLRSTITQRKPCTSCRKYDINLFIITKCT